jgi:GT2 family glycosyltransferase
MGREMIDIIILNRNLGEVCDALVAKLSAHLDLELDNMIVVDSGSEPELKSRHTSIGLDDERTRQHGLRFGRGMNLGLEYRRNLQKVNPWVLLLPVDTEIIKWDLHRFLGSISNHRNIAAIKPASKDSEYLRILGDDEFRYGWNFEEGAWLISSSFLDFHFKNFPDSSFFDESNFRGYLTSLELAFRAYINGFSVGITSSLVVFENETHLLERSDLIRTEPIGENQKLLLEEGLNWLHRKYQIQDAWDFAQLVRLTYDQFLKENPDLSAITIINHGAKLKNRQTG